MSIRICLYALLIFLCVLPKEETFNFICTCSLFGFVFADCKNKNVRSLMMLITIFYVIYLEFLSMSSYLLRHYFITDEALVHLINGFSALSLLLIMKLIIFYRSPIINCFRGLLGLADELFTPVFVEVLISRLLTIFIAINLYIICLIASIEYHLLDAVSNNFSISKNLLASSDPYIQIHKTLIGKIIILFFVVCIVTITIFSQRKDCR